LEALPHPPLHFPLPPLPLTLSLLFTSPALPLPQIGPQIQLGGLGGAVSSPSGVWDATPAEIEFGAF